MVAGPGTGKTTLFKKLLSIGAGNNLALTFINNLAKDLERNIGEFAKCFTLHGYCTWLIHDRGAQGLSRSFETVPKLPDLISTDAKAMGLGGEDDLAELFRALTLDGRTEFYLQRASYYNATGFDDAVYRVLREFREGRWERPVYSQIVVDEFQDFNPLEVAVIQELQQANNVLVVGDDDQALYPFRGSSARYIRDLFSGREYAQFPLPYCSRCTQVIVRAVADVVRAATARGFLGNRIPKRFECYLPSKITDSEAYPTISNVSCSMLTKDRNYPAMFVESEIRRKFEGQPNFEDPGKLRVLVICPRKYLRAVGGYLESRFRNIARQGRGASELRVLDGYRLLLKDETSNIGWRIVLQFEPADVLVPIINSSERMDVPLYQLLPRSLLESHREALQLLKKLGSDQLSQSETEALEKALRMNTSELTLALAGSGSGRQADPVGGPWLRVTSFQGAKGLDAEFVFVLGMNNGDFPETPGRPSELEICSLIVAITRASKKCYLVSNQSFGREWNKKPSDFIWWLDGARLDHTAVNAEYFRRGVR